jgi:protoporphyrin/coproporphyrin ferrochelatase
MSQSTGVLLIQLGTPDAPTASALYRYLRQFLSDKRVIETPPALWWPILYFVVLPTRPKASAAKYRRIWDPGQGSPLLYHTQKQAEALEEMLPGVPVVFGMQVGNPSVASVVRQAIADGIERLIVLPMYPQYSATTTGSALDSLFRALEHERRVPALRIVPPYYQNPSYVDAVASVMRQEIARLDWQPDHFLISFHGLPLKYVERGDPYADQVRRTTALLTDRLQWQPGSWTQTFQSRFGRSRWLEPYTDETLAALGKCGKSVFVITPGFTADCLETLDEIGNEARAIFLRAGGRNFHLCPCLNEHPEWIGALKSLVSAEGQGWLSGPSLAGRG